MTDDPKTTAPKQESLDAVFKRLHDDIYGADHHESLKDFASKSKLRKTSVLKAVGNSILGGVIGASGTATGEVVEDILAPVFGTQAAKQMGKQIGGAVSKTGQTVVNGGNAVLSSDYANLIRRLQNDANRENRLQNDPRFAGDAFYAACVHQGKYLNADEFYGALKLHPEGVTGVQARENAAFKARSALAQLERPAALAEQKTERQLQQEAERAEQVEKQRFNQSITAEKKEIQQIHTSVLTPQEKIDALRADCAQDAINLYTKKREIDNPRNAGVPLRENEYVGFLNQFNLYVVDGRQRVPVLTKEEFLAGTVNAATQVVAPAEQKTAVAAAPTASPQVAVPQTLDEKLADQKKKILETKRERLDPESKREILSDQVNEYLDLMQQKLFEKYKRAGKLDVPGTLKDLGIKPEELDQKLQDEVKKSTPPKKAAPTPQRRGAMVVDDEHGLPEVARDEVAQLNLGGARIDQPAAAEPSVPVAERITQAVQQVRGNLQLVTDNVNDPALPVGGAKPRTPGLGEGVC